MDISHFTAVFPTDGPMPYDDASVRQIATYRKSFDGVLFIDRVLRALGISEGKQPYPPRSENALRTLHQQIVSSPSAATQSAKLSVLFYILLDYDDVRGSRLSQLAESMAEEFGLPRSYQILMRGLWHMDRAEYKFALEHLCDPSLPSEFADDIVTVLVRHASKVSKSTGGEDDFSLALAYYHTTQPVLKTSEALELLFGALARTSVAEGLYFSRRYPEATRELLFEKLVASVLEHPQAVGLRGKELVSLPLLREEEKWFQEYITGKEGKRSKNARVVAQMREIVTGRIREPLGGGGVKG
ncbi:protein ELYS [Podospora australis]|uniref:Protein ELYS n=1 Tax=Podospora australis TaxID=1536484 RepID=A0AAN6X3J9_9PEZI|nr:protein ELYS [Podospora australis]